MEHKTSNKGRHFLISLSSKVQEQEKQEMSQHRTSSKLWTLDMMMAGQCGMSPSHVSLCLHDY